MWGGRGLTYGWHGGADREGARDRPHPGVFDFGHRASERTFSVGWPGSGLPFHAGGDTWHELLYGETMWRAGGPPRRLAASPPAHPPHLLRMRHARAWGADTQAGRGRARGAGAHACTPGSR